MTNIERTKKVQHMALESAELMDDWQGDSVLQNNNTITNQEQPLGSLLCLFAPLVFDVS